ncbi:MAG: hypothetical protein AAFY17_06200 [Cyanobacteria bacterium J06642_11]
MKKIGLYLVALTFAIGVGLASCDLVFVQGLSDSLRPVPPPYPYFSDRSTQISEAQRISDRLEDYIRDWMDGEASAEIPNDLIPAGRAGVSNYYLQRPEEVRPSEQWGIREAEDIDFSALHGASPDPHATYMVLGTFLAPFGNKVIMEGEFPHSRFFDVQLSPPFDPNLYIYEGAFGAPEVPIVDVDMDPLPGHINPFRVGADRNATNRRYRLTWTLAIGNGPEMEPAYRPPHYRAPGNHRFASALVYQGPWGDPQWKSDPVQYGHGLGVWQPGYFWVRYYAPDREVGPLGGVPLPKVLYELPDGRQYYINADYAEMIDRVNATIPAGRTWPEEPNEVFFGPNVGWDKMWGIFLGATEGLIQAVYGNDANAQKPYLRQLNLGVTGRGENQPPPGNYASSASSCPYIHYMTRGMSLGWGKIVVLTGRMPQTPRTRNGEPIMEGGQARYFSITSYDVRVDAAVPTAALTSVMDDEIVTDENGWYMIVYSRITDRPANATPANNATWVDWGPTAVQSWNLRWMTVHPEWNDTSIPVPDEANMSWATSTWSGSRYNPELIGRNNHDGFLREYLPRVHYMTKSEFEALGSNVRPETLPIWR